MEVSSLDHTPSESIKIFYFLAFCDLDCECLAFNLNFMILLRVEPGRARPGSDDGRVWKHDEMGISLKTLFMGGID